MENEERFSEDRDEDLRIENELLRLKLTAQFGEAFEFGKTDDLPPEIENQFLKNVLAFEENYHHSSTASQTLYEFLGKPVFTESAQLTDLERITELERLIGLMAEKGVDVHFKDGPYSTELMYKFITEELFQEESPSFITPGMRFNFIYEEFHPNNKAEIERHTHSFLMHWLTQNFNEYSDEMGYVFFNGQSQQLSREETYKKIKLFSDCYHSFQNDGYNIYHIQVDEQPDGTAFGFSEGAYKYEGTLENGDVQRFEGPFKLYMRREDNYWSIFHFIIPGFEL